MSRGAYYNEFDPFAAEWLRKLMLLELIAPGDVDERSIEDVTPDDLRGYSQCHFFAGIGVWSHALRRAGWSDDREIWTGSCPCQPFSAAGKGDGFADERHLWPAFFHLIRECRPGVVVGEQVASKDGLAWLDLVHADMEGEGHAFGCLDLCAAGFGAPHIRQRLYWSGVALGHPGRSRLEGQDERALGRQRAAAERTGGIRPGLVAGVDVADTAKPGRGGRQRRNARQDGRPAAQLGRLRDVDGLALAHDAVRRPDLSAGNDSRGQDAGRAQGPGDARAGGGSGRVADDDGEGCGVLEERNGGSIRGRDVQPGPDVDGRGGLFGLADDASGGRREERQDGGGLVAGDRAEGLTARPGDGLGHRGPGPTNGFWRDADWLGCRDAKWRPVEPGTFPLVNGASNRVGALRGYGNAVAAPVAQGFIESLMEVLA